MKRLILSVCAALALTACGGGGDGPAPAYLAGTYTPSMGKTEDNCGIGSARATTLHIVSVEGESVTAQVGSVTMKGSANGRGGFDVRYESKGTSSTSKASLTYALPEGQSAPGSGTFDANILLQGIDNATGFTCNLRYIGQATKQ